MLTTTRTVVDGIGTPAYMSPEQHLNKKMTHQTDIYALGVVMFQLLTGRLPFQADNIAALSYQVLNADRPLVSEYRRDIPGEIDIIVRRAIERDPRSETRLEEFSDTSSHCVQCSGPKHACSDREVNSLRTCRSSIPQRRRVGEFCGFDCGRWQGTR